MCVHVCVCVCVCMRVCVCAHRVGRVGQSVHNQIYISDTFASVTGAVSCCHLSPISCVQQIKVSLLN